MYCPTTYATALADHPKLVAEVLAHMKDCNSLPDASVAPGLEWGFRWSAQIAGPFSPVATTEAIGNTPAGLIIRLAAKDTDARTWTSDSFIATPPPDVVACYDEMRRPPVIGKDDIHLLLQRPASAVAYLALGGYEMKIKNGRLMKVVSLINRANAQHGMLYEIVGDTASFRGSFTATPEQRFLEAHPGDSFTWNHKTFRKLTLAELRELVHEKTFHIAKAAN